MKHCNRSEWPRGGYKKKGACTGGTYRGYSLIAMQTIEENAIKEKKYVSKLFCIGTLIYLSIMAIFVCANLETGKLYHSFSLMHSRFLAGLTMLDI